MTIIQQWLISDYRISCVRQGLPDEVCRLWSEGTCLTWVSEGTCLTWVLTGVGLPYRPAATPFCGLWAVAAPYLRSGCGHGMICHEWAQRFFFGLQVYICVDQYRQVVCSFHSRAQLRLHTCLRAVAALYCGGTPPCWPHVYVLHIPRPDSSIAVQGGQD